MTTPQPQFSTNISDFVGGGLPLKNFWCTLQDIVPNFGSDQKFVEQFAVGDMLIAYGYPSMIRDDVIGLFPTPNLRAIKPESYRTDILEYGRPNEPTMH